MIVEKYIRNKLKIAVILFLIRDLYQSAKMRQIKYRQLKIFKVSKLNIAYYYFFRIEFSEQWQTDPGTDPGIPTQVSAF